MPRNPKTRDTDQRAVNPHNLIQKLRKQRSSIAAILESIDAALDHLARSGKPDASQKDLPL